MFGPMFGRAWTRCMMMAMCLILGQGLFAVLLVYGMRRLSQTFGAYTAAMTASAKGMVQVHESNMHTMSELRELKKQHAITADLLREIAANHTADFTQTDDEERTA